MCRGSRKHQTHMRKPDGIVLEMVTIAAMNDFHVEIEREEDGRWIGEVAELPGVLAYGATEEEAVARAKALALRVLAERKSIVATCNYALARHSRAFALPKVTI